MRTHYLIFAIILLAVALIGYKAGYHQGEKNGYVALSVQNTGPFWNLLLLQSNSKEEMIELNEGSLLGPIVSLHHFKDDPFISSRTKKEIDYYILAAKDYVKHIGAVGLPKKDQVDLPIQPDLYLDGTKVPHNYFELIDEERNRIFREVWDQDSYLIDDILKTKDSMVESGSEGY